MQELMSRQRYQEMTMTEMPAAFPWAQEALIVVAPGHLEIANRYLGDVESIVGKEALYGRLKFLRLTDTEEMGLRVYIDVEGLSEVRASAISDAGMAAIEASRRICAACGKPVMRRDRYCTDHAEQRVLFTDDLPSQPEMKSEDEVRPETNDIDIFAELFPDVASDCCPDQQQRHEVPQIVVFSETDVAELEKSAEGKDSETRERIRAIVKKLRGTAAVKPLAMLRPDWREMLEKFEADFPNFGEFVEFLRDQFALCELGDKRIAIPPVLFDGPPGIGKTEVALSLAALIDTDAMELDMAMAQASSALSGSDAFWSNSKEGRLFELLAYGRTGNPLVFLDELDKVSGDERYRPDAALYQLLEPRTAKSFQDLSIPAVKLDASQVLWIAASNDLERVNAPIRSRFVVFNIPLPTPKQSAAIAHSIYRRLIERNAWGTAMTPDITDAVANRLAELPPRVMRMQLSQACGRAARQGRRELMAGDICFSAPAKRAGIGFVCETA